MSALRRKRAGRPQGPEAGKRARGAPEGVPPAAAAASFHGVSRELWSVLWTAHAPGPGGAPRALGTFDTAAMAARAHDLAVLWARLRGGAAAAGPGHPGAGEPLNFPEASYHPEWLAAEGFGELPWADLAGALEDVSRYGEAAVVGVTRSPRFRGVVQRPPGAGDGAPEWLARWEEREPAPGDPPSAAGAGAPGGGGAGAGTGAGGSGSGSGAGSGARSSGSGGGGGAGAAGRGASEESAADC